MEQEVEVTSGIRQGCTGSTTLFKLITNMIIKKINEGGRGFCNELIKLGVLFFADDALVLAENLEDAKFNIRILVEIGKKCGLDIYKDKSSILIYNKKEKPEQIEGIKVVDNIKYLGLKIDDKRNMFKTQNSEMITKAQNLATLTYSIIEKSCNKIMIGKTYWKSVALPSILYGVNIMHLTETEIEKLQNIENGVYRKILGAVKRTPKVALRGDIGASAMRSRIVEGKLQYINSIYKGDKDLLKAIIQDMQDKNSNWWNKCIKYAEECKLTMKNVIRSIKQELKDYLRADPGNGPCQRQVLAEYTNNNKLKENIRKWDTEEWLKEVNQKQSLCIYKSWKNEIKEEVVYDNTYSSVLLLEPDQIH